MPQRRTTSSLIACNRAGSGSGSSFGTVIHGSPRRRVIRTPPAEPPASAVSSPVRASRIRCCSPAMNAVGSVGCRSAA
ncbi:hypothetical protein [Amycolatopsis sp. A1MSW2902]|uniref:hypothetical protein n=1 Tax=Amycolatopsis sp. A1MSW2902 TaxID=687413 RepID=UPI00307F958F